MDRRYNPHAECRVITREDGTRAITGYAAVFYRADDPGTEFELWEGMNERIMPKTFDRALKERDDVRALFNHDSNQVLGRSTSDTLKLSTDAKGLKYEIDLPDTQVANDLAVSIERGDITGSSFSFSVSDEDFKKRDGGHIREIRGVDPLFDVGPVTFPAYESTTTGIRSLDDCKEATAGLARYKHMSVQAANFRRMVRSREVELDQDERR